jgi:hypothetical protein
MSTSASSTDSREPRILLADADAFFVAVARLVDPEGAGKASLLIVGGRPGSRGVVCSASYEARAYGVRSGMGITEALRLCPAAMAVPVPRRACSEKSRAIQDVLERFAPVVAAASVDEFYLDLTGTEAVYQHEPLAATARRIRQAVIDETGCSVSIGGGTSTLIAKIAAGAAKPMPSSGATGVHIVPAGVGLSHLDDGEITEQLSLLPDAPQVVTETPRDRALATAVDRVRARFGAGAMKPASLLVRAAPTSVEDRSETDGT